MSSIVIQDSEGDFGLWRFRPLDELGLKEADLEKAIVAQPKALVMDPLEMLSGEVKAYPQTVLSFGGSARKPDVIIVTDHGEVVVVEVKRAVNDELRDGRRAIAQVVEYASLLAQVSESDLVNALTNERYSSWDLLCRHDLGQGDASSRLANVLRKRIKDGEIHLVVACEQAPHELTDLVQAATNSKALAFALHVVEVRPMVPHGVSEADGHPIAWVPWPRLDTEIVHQTSVIVRAEGFEDDGSPSIVVRIQNDSARQVEEKVAKSSRRDRKRREREMEAQQVLRPLADRLDMPVEELWQELGKLHQAVEVEDWSELNSAIAQPKDAGPVQRGHRNTGEGRYGVNLLSIWKPSVFIGAYLLEHDHKQRLLAPDVGGDFALILDVYDREDRENFGHHPCIRALRNRLRDNAGQWDFADHHAQPKRNSYHPLHLRRPLQDVIGDTHSPEERKRRWLAAAHDAVETLLQGGELAEFRRQSQEDS